MMLNPESDEELDYFARVHAFKKFQHTSSEKNKYSSHIASI